MIHLNEPSPGFSRRGFLAASAAGATVAFAGPTILTAKKTESKQTIVGEGDYRYEVQHAWPQLPSKFSWQTTHNVAVDSHGCLYVIHEGRANQTDHPSIFVFDPDGKFMRAFGSQFQGGGHGLEVRQEGGEEFLYVCAYQHLKSFAKLSLKGETVWQKHAPMDSAVYAKDEDTKPEKVWGRDRFLPTNFAFLADGGFMLVDGYGSYYIHRYDKDANWVSCFGGPGKGEGKFNLPHGIWIDTRNDASEPVVVICDRANHTVQSLSVDGKHLSTQDGYGLPANADTWKNLMVIPELVARVTLLDETNQVVARLGGDVDRIQGKDGRQIRNKPDQWQDGRFVHPHDACFDQDGNIFVAEWVNTGRISRLRRIV